MPILPQGMNLTKKRCRLICDDDDSAILMQNGLIQNRVPLTAVI